MDTQGRDLNHTEEHGEGIRDPWLSGLEDPEDGTAHICKGQCKRSSCFGDQ